MATTRTFVDAVDRIVHIPHNPQRLVSPDVAGLYPCGEGAGYAGGIVSAALDGMRVARAIIAGR